jgi:hypothetical protein
MVPTVDLYVFGPDAPGQIWRSSAGPKSPLPPLAIGEIRVKSAKRLFTTCFHRPCATCIRLSRQFDDSHYGDGIAFVLRRFGAARLARPDCALFAVNRPSSWATSNSPSRQWQIIALRIVSFGILLPGCWTTSRNITVLKPGTFEVFSLSRITRTPGCRFLSFVRVVRLGLDANGHCGCRCSKNQGSSP